jgi:hypothetical protein
MDSRTKEQICHILVLDFLEITEKQKQKQGILFFIFIFN